MTVVVGTAGHIDHGKTTLLRALTGIDADRLPEERRRGMTIDVGYAHLTLPDGRLLDFVDVPGHDRLVGNMLVGAGEIDAAMLVVAADDGPRAQTHEHLELLDALGIGIGIAVVTKADVVDGDRVEAVVAEVAEMLIGTSLAGSPVVAVSGVEPDWPGRSAPGQGATGAVGTATEARCAASTACGRRLRPSIAESAHAIGVSMTARATPSTEAPTRSGSPIDRAFAVKGRGAIVTGTLRGGSLVRGATLRLVPGDRAVRVRDIEVHGVPVDVAGPGRTALNLAGRRCRRSWPRPRRD